MIFRMCGFTRFLSFPTAGVLIHLQGDPNIPFYCHTITLPWVMFSWTREPLSPPFASAPSRQSRSARLTELLPPFGPWTLQPPGGRAGLELRFVLIAREPQVLVIVSIYQGDILGSYFDPQPPDGDRWVARSFLPESYPFWALKCRAPGPME